MTPREKTISCLNEIREVFNQAGVRFVLTDGLVLAYGRYKDLMDWDLKDIDIGVFTPVHKIKKLDIVKDFVAREFTVTEHPTVHRVYLKGFLGIQKNDIRVAIYYYERNREYFDAVYLSGRGKRRWLAKWFINPKCIRFLGNEYCIPNHIDDYLTNTYGINWKTNIIKNIEEWQKERTEHPELYPYPKFVAIHVLISAE